MSPAKSILLISPTDPQDFSTGGAQRTQFLHQALSRMGNVYTIVPVPLQSLVHEDAERRVAFRCLHSERGFFWLLDRLVQKAVPIMRIPLLISPRKRCGWPEVEFDCVVVRYTQWAAYSRAWAIAPLFLDVDDLPTESFQTLHAKAGPGLFRRTYDAMMQAIVRRWSKYVFRRCRGLWIANPDQVTQLDHPNARSLTNLPRVPKCEPDVGDEQGNYILSVGYLGYEANIQGMGLFLTQTWLLIREQYPALEYWIVGKDLPEEKRRSWSQIEGVRILGFVDDIEAVYRNCLFSVAPIYAGSGTCIKVLESMRLGRVCLASPFAVRGLEEIVPRLQGIMVGHSARQMAEQACRLLADPQERLRRQVSARQEALREWSFDAFANHVRLTMAKPPRTNSAATGIQH